MSQFAEGARATGEAAARALFEKLRRDWANAVSGLDTLVESRAAYRGANERTLTEAQAAALEGLETTFDILFAEWTSAGAETPGNAS